MSTLLMTIIAIAIVDSINPNAVAVQIYLLSTSKPVARSLAFIAGDFLAAWIAGLLIILGIVAITQIDSILSLSMVSQNYALIFCWVWLNFDC